MRVVRRAPRGAGGRDDPRWLRLKMDMSAVLDPRVLRTQENELASSNSSSGSRFDASARPCDEPVCVNPAPLDDPVDANHEWGR